MKNIPYLIIVILLFVLFKQYNTEPQIKITTTIIRDTIFVEVPEPIYTEVVRYEYIEVPKIEKPKTGNISHLNIEANEVVGKEKIIENTSLIEPNLGIYIPIEQKTFQTDEYKAVIEGYKPSLISLDIYHDTHYIKETIRQKPKRWSVGVNCGYGYGIMHGKPDVYIGVGVQYRLF